MYKILNSKYDGETGFRVCDIYVDTATDLPTKAQQAYEFIQAGSWAWIGDERTFKTLDSEGEWI